MWNPQTKIDIVDPRDWNGFSLNGSNDNSTILQAAIDEASIKTRTDLGYMTSKKLMLPAGRIAFVTPLNIKQQTWIDGAWDAMGGSELWFVGADATNAIYNAATALSMCRFTNFRLEDKRVNPTSGRGISIKDFDNGVLLKNLQVMQFPSEQIYVGADSGTSCDCVEIDNIWVVSTVHATSKGILCERVDNYLKISTIRADIKTTPANDGYVIRVIGIPNERTTVSISNVKHESLNRCPTISIPQTTLGNISIHDITQQQSGIADHTHAGDVVQFGALAGGSSFAVNGSNISGWVTGSNSEGGGRCTLENISGENHDDWTGATGAATIRMLGSSTANYGHVTRATLGKTGRIRNERTGGVQPQASVYGNQGDTYYFLGGVSGDCPMWVKRSGNATNTGWQPTSTQSYSQAYAATINPNFNNGTRYIIAALTGNVAINAPTNIPVAGTPVQFDLAQDTTGGRTLTWGSNFKGFPTASGTASQKLTIMGISDGTNILLTGSSGWYS